MKLRQRVVWSEGMFMSPQHLQQQDDYNESILAARLKGLAPHGWGVLSMEVDGEALAAGQLQLRHFEGVLPDGTALAFEQGTPEAPPARSVEEHLRAARRLDVFLGVPKDRQGIDSYATGEVQTSTTSRFTVVNWPVADALAAGSIVPVAFARPNVRLLFGSESRDDFECLKLAVVTRDGLGALKLDESYSPPCLRIDASPFIHEGLRRLLRSLLSKQRELADARRHRDASSVEFTPADVTKYLQLSSLNGLLPVLNHLVEAGDAHPHTAYLHLLNAAGQLCTFVPDADPLALPAFQFTSLGETFGGLFDQLGQMLRGVSVESSIPVPLEQRPGGLHVGKLDERLARCAQFVLSVKSELPESQVADQLPRLSKLASPKDMQRIVEAATPGVPLQATYRPPAQIPVRPGNVYFTLSTQDAYWKNAVSEGFVVLYLPKPFDPQSTRVELLAVPGANEATIDRVRA